MNSKERFDFYLSKGLRKPDEDLSIVISLVNRLIENLYTPKEGKIAFVVDNEKTKHYGVDGEPINWGDLKVCDVVKEVEVIKEIYRVTIDEAAPNDCPNLCAYIEKYMHSWGWDVQCWTEW